LSFPDKSVDFETDFLLLLCICFSVIHHGVT